MRDNFHNLKFVPVIDPATNTNLASPLVGAVVDRAGFESVTYVIQTGDLDDTAATYAVLLEESDEDTFGGEENAVADADLIGTEADAGFDQAADVETRKLGYKGHKRYTRLTITPTGAGAGDSPISALCVLGHAHDRPVA